MLRTFKEVLEKAREFGPKKMAVAAPQTEDVLEAVETARKEGLADSILIGDKVEIIRVAEKMNINLGNYELIDQPDKTLTAKLAVELVSTKKASLLMKGMMGTARLLKAALDKEVGLRTNRLLSHVYTLEIKTYPRLLTMTDGAMNINPDLNQKAQIIQNAIDYARALGIEKPKIAVLAALELVNPDMPATIDAASLAKMSERGQIVGGIVDGPLAFDNAISRESARHKGIDSVVAGEVDIVVVPNIETGNVFAKALVYLAQAMPAGLVVGAKAPVVLTSRADSSRSKLYSIALGVLMDELKK